MSLTIIDILEPEVTGQRPSALSVPVVLASDQSPIPVTLSSGGESNYALETGGNLATIATAQGASGSGIVQPTGGSGILGWLSGIYNKLATSIAVTIGSLPLPTNAAQETGGNLAALAAAMAANTLPVKYQNTSTISVQDTSISDGLSQIEILSQILAELKVHSQYLYDLPYQLNYSTFNAGSDEPQVLRDSGTIYQN